MYEYIRGTITSLHADHIVLDNNGIGFFVYVPNPYAFKRNNEYTIYIYQSISEANGMKLFGFESYDQKELFMNLIKVKNIGPKSAIAILASGGVDDIINAIENNNTKYLKSFPGIGPKAASQIVLDLKGKLHATSVPAQTTLLNDSVAFEEATEVLVALGYTQAAVDKAMATLVNEDLDTNGFVHRGLAILSKM